MAFLILRNERDAEEVLSDTLLVAWRKAGAVREEERIRSWLLTTATRLALRRRRTFRPRVVSLDVTADVAGRHEPIDERLSLQAAVNALPPRMRAALALHDLADLPIAEVAAAVGSSENTVKSQIREARARLRQALGDDRA